MKNYQTICTANAIIQIRAVRNMTQIEFSDMLNVSIDAVVAWENGRNTISQRTLNKIRPKLTDEEYNRIIEAVRCDKLNRKNQ